MEVCRQHNVHNGRKSDCRSYGSNQHLSSQSRKISIGVIDDSLVGRKSTATKVQEDAVPNADGLYCDLVKSTGKKTDVAKSKQCEAPQLFDSPWVSTRSLHHDASIAETAIGTKRIFISPASWGKPSNSNGAKDTPATYSANVFADDTSILQSGKSERKFGYVHFHKKGEKDLAPERRADLSFSPAVNVVLLEKVGTDNEAGKTGEKTESLRMKLLEILGTVSSPNDHQHKSQSHDQGGTNLNTEQNIAQKAPNGVKSGKNSDTIETDSEDPEQTITKPKARSLCRKRAPAKFHSKKAKSDACSSYKFKRQEENVFTFEPGLRRTPHDSVHGSSSMSEKRKIRASKTKPAKNCVTVKCDADHIDQKTCKAKAQVSAERTSLLGNVTHKFPDCDSKPANDEEYCQPGKITKEIFDQSPLAKKGEPPQYHNDPVDADQREDVGNPYFKNSLDPHPSLQSPTLKINTPVYSSPTLSPEASDILKSPVLARRETVVEDITSFRKLHSLEKDSYSNAEDFSEEDDEFLFRRKAANTREREAEDDRSESSCEETFENAGGTRKRAAEIGMTEKLKFMLHPVKKLKFDSTVPQNNDWTEEPLEQSQEDELARAVKLFSMELERIKRKMKSLTVKKSSEILVSVADETDLQLQNVRSQIETEVAKMTNLCKSKRKQLETIITEQQDELKVIHEKFNQEVNQHLQYCKTTLHDLEAHQVEIKGAMEKRRTSHRNILLQAEEAVNERLNEGQRKIRRIQELARGKMLHLKKIIATCLEEG